MKPPTRTPLYFDAVGMSITYTSPSPDGLGLFTLVTSAEPARPRALLKPPYL